MKPRIRKCSYHAWSWVCSNDSATGFGVTPAHAYEVWLRYAKASTRR